MDLIPADVAVTVETLRLGSAVAERRLTADTAEWILAELEQIRLDDDWTEEEARLAEDCRVLLVRDAEALAASVAERSRG